MTFRPLEPFLSYPSLATQVRWARLWLPALIVGVVLVHQLLIVPLGGPGYRFWMQLLFYAILGPLVTFVVLNWISEALDERELAQVELQRLYRELRESYAVLGSLQRVTEQFAAAPDLEATVRAAVVGVRDATGAQAAAAVLGQKVLGMDMVADLEPAELEAQALRADGVLAQGLVPEPAPWQGRGVMVTLPLAWGGRHEGSLHAWFASQPDEQGDETLRIIAADFSAAAKAVQARTRDLLTLFEVDRTVRAEDNLTRLLDTLLTQMASRVAASNAGVYLMDEGALELRAAVGVEAEEALQRPAAPVRLGQGLIGRAAKEGQSRVISGVSEQDRREGAPLLARAGSVALLPLRTGEAPEQLHGVVVLTHADEGRFEEASLPFLALVASQVSLAVRNADAYMQSEELAIAEERARIAREIHDGVAQSLAFAALKLDLVARLLERDRDKAQAELRAAKETIREMIREVRRSIFALRPVDLERHGLLETIRRYAVDFGEQNDVQMSLNLAQVGGLSVKSEAVLFRIFQEAMNNVAKHARAREVQLSLLQAADGSIVLEVGDDGEGFEPSEVHDRVSSAGGLGLKQMHERVAGRGGTLQIESSPGRGTRLRARVPA